MGSFNNEVNRDIFWENLIEQKINTMIKIFCIILNDLFFSSS